MLKKWICAIGVLGCLSALPALAAYDNATPMPYAPDLPTATPQTVPYLSEAPDPQTLPYPMQAPEDGIAYDLPGAVEDAELFIPPADNTTPPLIPPDALWTELPGLPGYGTVDRPDRYWPEGLLPDDIVYIEGIDKRIGADGEQEIAWEIGLFGADEERQKELLALFSDQCYISFTDMKYPYDELERCRSEIDALRAGDANIAGTHITRGHVVVGVAQELVQEYEKRLGELYGDKIVVSTTNYYTGIDGALTGEGGQTQTDDLATIIPAVNTAPKNTVLAPWMLMTAALLLLCGGAVLYRNRVRFIAVIQTQAGVVTHELLTRKQTEAAIRNSAITPPPGALASVREHLEDDPPV